MASWSNFFVILLKIVKNYKFMAYIHDYIDKNVNYYILTV